MSETDRSYWLNRSPFFVMPGLGATRHRELMAERLAAYHRGKQDFDLADLALDRFESYMGNLDRLGLVASNGSFGPVLYME